MTDRITCPCCDGAGTIEAAPLSFRRPMVAHYIAEVSRVSGIPIRQIIGRHRYRELVRARDMIAFLAYAKGYSNQRIANALGGRDPSTVSASRLRAIELVKYDQCFRDELQKVEAAVVQMAEVRAAKIGGVNASA
jgi:chromosomal replication initiation ATPase DnaA